MCEELHALRCAFASLYRENVALREAVEQAGDFSILDNDGLTLIKFRDTGTYLRALSVKLDPHE